MGGLILLLVLAFWALVGITIYDMVYRTRRQ